MAKSVVFLRDRFVDEEEAVVPLVDRGYLLGDSVFATLRALGGRVFQARLHVERLRAASASLGIAWPLEHEDVVDLAHEATSRLGALDATLRITLSRGVGSTPGIGTLGPFAPTFSILARPTVLYPAEAYTSGLDTALVTAPRIPAACLPSAFKTGNYLPNILARRELEEKGYIEGIQRAWSGELASGTVSNLFLVRGRELLTPHLASECRPGVTREVLLGLSRRSGLTPLERALGVEDLASADEVFFASTLMECLPVRRIEAIAEYGSFSRTAQLRSALGEAMGSRLE